MITRARRASIVCGLAIAAAIAVIGAETPDPARAEVEARALQILDGDTIVLRGGERVRYLGIDAPETGEPFALEAKDLNQALVRFRDIRLEFDARERDSYGRLLAHVYVETDDGWILVNLEMVRAGLARVLFIPPNNRYRELYETALHEAMVARRGLWGRIPGVLTVEALEADPVSRIAEVVTVVFTVARVEDRPDGRIIRPAESSAGFHILIPRDAIARFSTPPVLGDRIEVTGVFECPSVAAGLRVSVTHPEQIVAAAPPPD